MLCRQLDYNFPPLKFLVKVELFSKLFKTFSSFSNKAMQSCPLNEQFEYGYDFTVCSQETYLPLFPLALLFVLGTANLYSFRSKSTEIIKKDGTTVKGQTTLRLKAGLLLILSGIWIGRAVIAGLEGRGWEVILSNSLTVAGLVSRMDMMLGVWHVPHLIMLNCRAPILNFPNSKRLGCVPCLLFISVQLRSFLSTEFQVKNVHLLTV
jgi:hypothetical protein